MRSKMTGSFKKACAMMMSAAVLASSVPVSAMSAQVPLEETVEAPAEVSEVVPVEETVKAQEEGLIASFSFDDEQSGLSGAGAVAELVGGTAKFSDDAIAGSGKSLEMDGSYYLDVKKENGESLLAGCKELTISYLSKTTSDNSFWSYFANNNSFTEFQRNYIGVLDKTTRITAERGSGQGTSPSKTVSASTEGWKMVTVVYTEYDTRVYVNEKSDSFTVNDYALSEMLGPDNRLTIGAGKWNNYTERYLGYLDDFRIYNYAMPESEVKKLHESKLAEETKQQELQRNYIPKLDLTNVFTDGAIMKSEKVSLPTEVEYRGTTRSVEWSSSKPGVVASDGTVHYTDADDEVVLTAAVTMGGVTLKKSFTVPVLSSESQLASFQNDFIIRPYVAAGEQLPKTYGAGTVTYTGSSAISKDGVVTAAQAAETEVTAVFSLNGKESKKTFRLHILPQTAGNLACYTRRAEDYQFYPENLSGSMHMASSEDGSAYQALNNDTGVLFAAGYYKNDESMATKTLEYPYLFYTKDGSYAVIAQYRDMGKEPTNPTFNYDEDHKGMLAVYTTDDLLYYSKEHFIRLSRDAHIQNAVCEYDTSMGKYVIHWEDTNGKYYRTVMADILDENSIEKTEPSTIMSFRQAETGLNGANNRNAIPVEERVYSRVVKKLSKIVNTGVEVPQSIKAFSGKEIEEIKATALYSDGSTDEKEVAWDYSKVDFGQPGTYEITGKVESGNEYGFGAELNNGGRVYCYDKDGNNQIIANAEGDRRIEGVHDSAKDWADPNIKYWNGKYYFVATNDWNGNIGIFLREADTIEGLFQDGVKAYEVICYNKEKGQTGLFWAPELHEVNGKLCMFYAIGLYGHVSVLEGTDPKKASDWSEPHEVVYEEGLRLDGNNGQYVKKRAMVIDMTYFEAGGKSYVVWSGRESVNGWGKGAFLYIATCDKERPWVLTSREVLIGAAEYSWEQNHGVVDEGAFALKRDGKVYLTFSGGSVDNTYAVGLMSAEEGADLLQPSNWKKNNYPILSSYSVPGIYGPGHSCFIEGKNGDILFVFHGRGPEWNSARTTGVRRVQFDMEGEPYLAMLDGEDLLEKYRTVTMKVVVRDVEGDQKAAEAVIAKIKAIGTVSYTEASKKRIDEARKAYEALTEDQKELVDNLQVLTAAEETYKKLEKAGSNHASHVGKTFIAGTLKYKVTKDNGKIQEVRVTSLVKKAQTVKIPKTVTNKEWKETFRVTSIKAKAFKGKAVKKAVIGASVVNIGPNAFLNCKNLKTVVVGKNVKNIGIRAFYGCTRLKKIVIKSKVLKNVKKNALKRISKKAVVKVPKGKKAAYKRKLKGRVEKGVSIR